MTGVWLVARLPRRTPTAPGWRSRTRKVAQIRNRSCESTHRGGGRGTHLDGGGVPISRVRGPQEGGERAARAGGMATFPRDNDVDLGVCDCVTEDNPLDQRRAFGRRSLGWAHATVWRS